MAINRQTTLLLDQGAWDLVLDAAGNWAIGGAPYSIAQDVSSAERTFSGECWYDQSLGLPYWQKILGQYPPLSLVRKLMRDTALQIPNVVDAKVVFTGYVNRKLSGQIQIIDTDGNTQNIAF